MFDLRICTASEAEHLRTTWATRTVSVVGSASPLYYASLAPNHHVSIFDDIEKPGHGVLVSREDIVSILQFTKDLSGDDQLLVHCTAGIGRSPAVAAAILAQHGFELSYILPFILTIRPEASPNRRVIELADQILGLNNGLIEATTTLHI